MADIISAPIKEFLRISGMGLTTAYRLLNEGEIESITVGRRRLVLIDSYRRFLERHGGTPAIAPLATPPITRGRPRRQVEATAHK